MNDNSDKKEENNKNVVTQNTERSIKEISESAEKLTKEANILVEIEEFDEAFEKYDKAIELYRQTENNSEIEKVFELIELCYDEKSRFLRNAIKDEPEERLKSKLEKYGTVQATDNKEQERIQRLMKLEREKEKEDIFKNTILQIARDAEKMEREYENAIKRGRFEEEPPFEKILQMYEDILNMLRDKGWTDQLSVYRNQIKIIQGKATKDKKLREIEVKKKEKEEEYLKSMKLSERKRGKHQKIAAAHEKVKRVEADTLFQQNIDKMVSEAESLEREYSLAIKKGDFNREPPFKKIIDIYQEVKTMLLERDWKEQVMIYTNQIRLINKEIEKDTKLREIEAKKKEKKEDYLKSMKQSERKRGKHQKIAAAHEKVRKVEEDTLLQQNIDKMVSEAKSLEREYNLAIKKGDFNRDPPFEKIIDIYQSVKSLLLERDWNEQAMIYSNQIKLINKEIEKDTKLREIEAKKKEKEEDYLKSMKLSERKKGDHQKIAAAHEKVKKVEEDTLLQQNIDKMVSEAKSLEREYNLAIKKGDFNSEPPFVKIIEIYENVKKMLLEKGWVEESAVYIKQINLIKLKWENDKNLREIEAKKKERDKEFQESFKFKRDEEFDVKEINRKEDKYRQKIEDKEFQSKIAKMSGEAEKLKRSYELEIKKGKFETEPPFNKIIKIYSEIKDMLQKKGWLDQASVYSNQIKITKDRMAHDNNLRDMETRKKMKDKEFLESSKVKKVDEIDIEKTRLAEEKLKKVAEDEIFQQQIDSKVNDAEKMIKTYKKEIKKGNFNTEPPYQKVIEIYEVIKNQLLERKWNELSIIYSNQIKFYEEKNKKDERLRKIEGQKVQKQKEYDNLLKVKATDKEIKADLDKLEEVKVQYQIDIEEEEFENQIIMMTDKAEKLVQRYELELRKGNFDERCIYPDVINIYEIVQNLLIDHNWSKEARLYNNQIDLYTQKLEQDQKLRAIEEEKVQKQKVYDDFYKIEREQEFPVKDQEKLKEVEDKYLREKEEQIFEHKITEMVNNAEEMARRYEFAIRKGKFEENPPYEEIIQIYENIKTQLLEKNWQEQSRIYSNQIKIYEDKLEKDKKLREIEAQKLVKEQQLEGIVKSKREDTRLKARKIEELEIRKREEEELSDRAFDLIDNAEKMVKNYELDLKKDILSRESPYDEVITLYKEARKYFIENGWNDEASRLISTIKFYNDKKDKDDKLRAIEIRKLEKLKARSVITISKMPPDLTKRKQKVADLEQKKKLEEDSSSEALNMIDEAERLVKKYELNLKAGIFPDSPYNQVITIYRQAKERFEDIGWSDQASGLIGTINFYKQKLNADNRLRTLEANKIEKQRIENEKRERMISRAQKREREILQQKQEAILLKNREESVIEEKKDAAFRLMDRAKRELNLSNFDEAIRLYTQSDTIFSDINWSDGRNMIQDSINVIEKKKQDIERQTQALIEEEKERRKIEKQLVEKIDKTRDLKEIELKQKRKDLAETQQQKAREKEVSESAYNLLEQGTKLIKKKKFGEAYEKYESARDMFQQIEWYQEVSRINNELLVKLKKEEVKALRFKEYENRKVMEARELERLISEAEQQKEVTRIANRKEKLGKVQISDKLQNKIEENLERATIIIQNYKYNEGILKFKEIIKMMKRIGGEKEISEINKQIQILISESNVPLPVIEDLKESEINDRFKSAYEALDRAQVSSIKNQYRKAISELNEAKFNLKETKIGQKYLEQIDNTISEFRGKIEKKRGAKEISGVKEVKKKKEEMVELSSKLAYEYMEKCKEEQRQDNFDKAIELATLAVEIFNKLGSEWSEEKSTVEKYILTLKNQKVARENLFKRKKKELEEQEVKLKQEEDEFKSRIAARREARKKKIQKLMEK